MKRFTITLTNDLFVHLEALKSYYGYTNKSEIIEKALDELINKQASDDVFQCYLSKVRKRLKVKELQDD